MECLGTKTLVADEMAQLTGKSYYDSIAQDTIAMAVNDLITVGATPLVVQAYWAAGGSDWFGDKVRANALVAGWKKACDTCQVAWVAAKHLRWELASWPMVESIWLHRAPASSTRRAACRWATSWVGDAIVLLASSGIHANGLSLARKLADDCHKAI